jgi:two-component system invasion response regulator UvrY
MINILIVDDHELVREGLKKVLKRQSDMNVVGEASNAHELFEQLGSMSVDVVILDITLPGKSGLEILKELVVQYPKIRSLVLSMHPEERFAVRAFKAGAFGYLTKDTAASELAGAIRRVMSGRKYASASLAEQLVELFGEHGSNPSHEMLSDREFEVLCLLATGKSVSQIALQLSLSVNTIATYRSRVLEKLKLKSNAELMRYALEHRLVD